MVTRHGIIYFSIVTSCFQGVSEAVILGEVYLFPFLSQDSASYPDTKVVVFVPVFITFMRYPSGIFLLLSQVLGKIREKQEFFSSSHGLSHNVKYDVFIKVVLDSSSGLASISAQAPRKIFLHHL